MTPLRVLAAAKAITGCTAVELVGTRTRDGVYLRKAVCRMMRAHGMTLMEIGRWTGRDHSTVVHHLEPCLQVVDECAVQRWMQDLDREMRNPGTVRRAFDLLSRRQMSARAAADRARQRMNGSKAPVAGAPIALEWIAAARKMRGRNYTVRGIARALDIDVDEVAAVLGVPIDERGREVSHA